MHIPDKIQRIMQAEHISEEELATMLLRAAISSQDGFNRRYFHWLFKVSGTQVQDMRHATLVEVGEGPIPVYEDHDDCAGAGCPACGWAGEIIRRVASNPQGFDKFNEVR